MNSPRAIERSVDKFYTSALLERAGLATPETVVCERSEDAIAAFREMRDVIVKPLFGSMGLGMVRVTDEEMAWRVFRALDAIRGVYYLQRTIDHGGRDVRAFVDWRSRHRRDRATGRHGRTGLAHQLLARRSRHHGDPLATVRRHRGSGSPRHRGRLRRGRSPAGVPMAPSTPSRSTGSRAGRACRKRPASTWRARSWTTCWSPSRLARARRPIRRSLSGSPGAANVFSGTALEGARGQRSEARNATGAQPPLAPVL